MGRQLGVADLEVPELGGRISAILGHPAFTAFARGHYLAPAPQQVVAGQASGDVKWQRAFSAEAGLDLRPNRAPLWLGASYRLDRYDFPGGAAGRLEQFEVLSVWGGFRVGR